MQHAPDAASRRSRDRGGRATDVDAHDPDRIGDLTAGTGGDRGKIEDAVGITLTQRDSQAFSIADVAHDLLEPAWKAGERPLRMFRNRNKIEADDALAARQQRFGHRQTDKARRPRDKSSHRIRPLRETACPNR
jgi:hypothetical protein